MKKLLLLLLLLAPGFICKFVCDTDHDSKCHIQCSIVKYFKSNRLDFISYNIIFKNFPHIDEEYRQYFLLFAINCLKYSIKYF